MFKRLGMMQLTYIIGLVVMCLSAVAYGDNNLGVLYGQDKESGNHSSYCVMFNPKFEPLALTLESAEIYAIADLNGSYVCNDTGEDPGVDKKAAFVKRGNCDFSQKALLVQKYGANAIVVISNKGLHEPVASDEDEYNQINISVSLMTRTDFDSLMSLGDDVVVQIFSPPSMRIDWNLVVIWFLSTGTVVAGAFWSGLTKHKKYLSRKRPRRRRGASGADENKEEEDDEDKDPESFDMSPQIILLFVVLMCGMLVSLYFFYDYLVYVVISMFTMASCTALYCTLKPLLLMIKCIGDCKVPSNKIPFFKRRPEVRLIFLFLICAGVAIWWAVVRNQSYAWILQDSLGIVFCVHMMKTIRMPSLMACSILLMLLFVYDIFFVFITPLFTKSGHSVMIDVATGGGSKSGELLPMVLKVPRITPSALSVCQLPYSLLGFGDIIVPGLLVSYCHGFDLKVGSKRLYFITSVIAYGVGMTLTFVALAMMDEGQPALLYLVPCTLLPTIIIGVCRRELRHLWNGKLVNIPKKSLKGNGTPASSVSDASNGNGRVRGTDGPDEDDGSRKDDGNHTNDDSDSEQPLLVNK